MCKFTFRHFFTVIVIINDVVFVGRGNRTNGTFKKINGPLCTINKENSPNLGANVVAHPIKLTSFVCGLRLLRWGVTDGLLLTRV